MKTGKRILSIFLAALLLLLTVPVAFGTGIVDSGSCGDDLIWTLDSDGLLTISGTGKMYDYYEKDDAPYAPWESISDSIKTIVIEDGVTTIGVCAFEDCSNLTSVSIPDTVTKIEWEAFAECTQLTDINIPNSVTEIGNCAFMLCNNLKKIRIPEGVTSISRQAFMYDVLLEIEIPASVLSIEEWALAFIKSIYVDENNPFYASENGSLFNKEKTALLQSTSYSVSGKLQLPETVTTISYQSIMSFSLNDIILSETIERIESESIYSLLSNSITVKSMGAELEANAIYPVTYHIYHIPEALKVNYIMTIMGLLEATEVIQPYLDSAEGYEVLVKEEPMILRCHEGSTAQAYAVENGMNCELVHFYDEFVSKTEPTETEPGYTTYKCIYCEATENRDFIYPETPHEHTPGAPARENEQPATCTATGSYDEVVYCTECGEELSRVSLTEKALGHNYGEWVTVKEATEEEEGLMQRTCKNDASHVETQVIPKKSKAVSTNFFQRIVQLLRDSQFFRRLVNIFLKLFKR